MLRKSFSTAKLWNNKTVVSAVDNTSGKKTDITVQYAESISKWHILLICPIHAFGSNVEGEL